MGKYFLGTQKNFWDQWSCGPILFPPLACTAEDPGLRIESFTINACSVSTNQNLY
jgi:hypothetical protein